MSLDLKFQKRNWHKIKCKIYNVEHPNKGYSFVTVFKAKRLMHFFCFNNILLPSIKLGETVVIWFTATSKEYKDKWFTNLTIHHMERPLDVEEEKLKQKIKDSNYLKLNFDEDEEE